jgi:GntR family transcriptional repressor for pyruvate dehydrogenase complex
VTSDHGPTDGKSSGPTVRARTAPSRAPQRPAKMSQIIAAEIVRGIVTDGLREGDRLPTEVEMLQQFDVGRASIREALRILESYGLIAIRQGQGGGPVVSAIDPQDLARTLSFYFHLTGSTFGELAEARAVIEPVMARLAAERRDPEQMRVLEDVMEREAAASLENPEYITMANEFHYAVSGLSGNSVLDLLGRALRMLYTTRISGGGILPPEARPASRRLHREIGEAILSGRADVAQQLMESHVHDLAELQAERTPEVMDQRVIWDG